MKKLIRESKYREKICTNYYLFSISAVTNCHKVISLKEHKCIILQFYMSEVRNGSYWAKTKVFAELLSFLEAVEEYLFSYIFQLLEVVLIPSSSQQCYHSNLCFHNHVFSSNSTSPAYILHLEGPCNYIRPTQTIQDNLPFSE